MKNPFPVPITPDWPGLVQCVLRKGEPKRVHFIELFLDGEVQEAICARYGVDAGLDKNDAFYDLKRQVAIQRFLGYDFIRSGIEGLKMPLRHLTAPDTAGKLQRQDGRAFIEEHKGPITNWEEFEKYPWPDPAAITTRALAWYEANLPEDMCIILSGGFAHFCEYLTWLMGYESLCIALYEQRDLVAAISRKLTDLYRVVLPGLLQFGRVKLVWGSDDMGFKTGPLISPADMREFVLPGHKLMAQISHDAGRPYLLHSCGKLDLIMEDLIEDVRMDAKHSFEDVIEPVTETKARYGRRIALLGGVDVDFLCRADEKAVRKRTRETLKQCLPGGGYCLGTGNSVANYIPLDNYLAMLDEGRKWGA